MFVTDIILCGLLLVYIIYYLNRISFAVVIAKCLGGSLFWDTAYKNHRYNDDQGCRVRTRPWRYRLQVVIVSTCSGTVPVWFLSPASTSSSTPVTDKRSSQNTRPGIDISSLSGQAPSYLADDIRLVSEGPLRRLRSSTDRSCAVPRTQHIQWQEFRCCRATCLEQPSSKLTRRGHHLHEFQAWT